MHMMQTITPAPTASDAARDRARQFIADVDTKSNAAIGAQIDILFARSRSVHTSKEDQKAYTLHLTYLRRKLAARLV
jgi:hypothetical protein